MNITVLHDTSVQIADRIVLLPALRTKRVIAGEELAEFKKFFLERLKPSWNPCFVNDSDGATVPEYRIIVEVSGADKMDALVQFSLGPECFTGGDLAYEQIKKYVREKLGVEDVPDVWSAKPKAELKK